MATLPSSASVTVLPAAVGGVLAPTLTVSVATLETTPPAIAVYEIVTGPLAVDDGV